MTIISRESLKSSIYAPSLVNTVPIGEDIKGGDAVSKLQNIFSRDDLTPIDRISEVIKIGTESDTAKVIGGFLDTENTLISSGNALADTIYSARFNSEDGYIPQLDMDGYEAFYDELEDARSTEEMEFLKGKIDSEIGKKEAFASATGWQKAAAIGTLMATSPDLLIGVGGAATKAYKAGNILKGAAYTAGVAAAIETGNELVLQGTQMTRTAEESVYNVAGATLLSGLLGGAVSALSKVEFDEMASNLTKSLDTDTEKYVDDIYSGSVGAAKVNTTTLFDEDIKGLAKSKKVFNSLPKALQNPVWLTMNSPSIVVRQISEKLADSSLIQNKNSAMIASEASVEGYKKTKYFFEASSAKAEKDAYGSYINRVKKGEATKADLIGSGKGGVLTRDEFNEQWYLSAIRKDTHDIPEISNYSKNTREEIFDRVVKKGNEVKLFDDLDPSDVETAESYAPRIYDKELIKSQRSKFKNEVVIPDLKANRDQAIFDKQTLLKSVEDIKKSIKIARSDLNNIASSSYKASFDETAKATKKELSEIMTSSDLDEFDILATKPKDIKGMVNRGVRKTIDKIYLDEAKKTFDDINIEFRSDLSLIRKEAISLDELEDGFDVFLKEIPDEAGVLIGDIKIDTKSIRDEITDKILEKVSNKEKADSKTFVHLSEDQVERMINKKLKSFIESKAREAAKNAAESARKTAVAPYKEKLNKLTKELVEARKKYERNSFKASIEDFELGEVAEELIDNITGVGGQRLGYSSTKLEGKSSGFKKVMSKRGSEKKRLWKIKDEKLIDWVVKDPRVIIDRYLDNILPDIGLMEKFGTLDSSRVVEEIRQDYMKLINKKVKDKKTGEFRELTPKEVRILTDRRDDDVRNIQALWDKNRGTYAMPDDYSAPAHTVERIAMSYNHVRLMGDVLSSSIADIGRPIMVHGFKRNFEALTSAVITDIKGFKMAKAEMEELGTALEITKGITALSRMNMDMYSSALGKTDKMFNKASNMVALVSGINHWNYTMKTFSGIVTQSRMLKSIKQFSETGKIPKAEMENLASHGIGKEEAIAIYKQFKKHGESRKGGIEIANAKNWDDFNTATKFRMAVRKEIDEIIVTPGHDRPLWLSRPGWRTIGQFKSFSFASNQRVLLSGMQRADMATFNGATMMILLGMLTYGYKTKVAGRELSEDTTTWIKEGVDRSGVTGMFMELNNILEKVTRGSVGISALTGSEPMSRYVSRSIVAALLGPSYGLATDIFSLTGSIASGDIKQADVHTGRKMLPLTNAPIFRQIFDKAEEGANRLFDISK